MNFSSELLGLSVAHWLVLVSAGLSVFGMTFYIRDTIKGTTKPNRVSFFLWALTPMIGTAAALYAHADGWVTFRVFVSGFMPFLALLASFVNPQSYWKLNRFDIYCGICSIIALIVWGVLGSPRMAILFAAIADGFACIPTLVKAWRHPETETGFYYIIVFFGSLIIIPAIPVWNIENSAFQIYLILANFSLLFAVYHKRLGFLKNI